MSLLSLPDAIAADLSELLCAALPVGSGLTADRVRLEVDADEIAAPRLVILAGPPRYAPKMPGTARVPISLEYVSSIDRMSPADHRAAAGAVDGWLRGVAESRRRQVLGSRVYLHELILLQPDGELDEADREQATAIRAEAVATLCAGV